MIERQREECKSYIEYIQNFDPFTVVRSADLGSILSFEGAVPVLQRIIDFYSKIPIAQIDFISSHVVKNLHSSGDRFRNIIKEILEFSPKSGGQVTDRDNLVSQLTEFYNVSFNEFYPLIGYFSGQRSDMVEYERQARNILNKIDENTSIYIEKFNNIEKDAQSILEQAKKVAAEQGVSQKAIYFKEEASEHRANAKKWGIITFVSAIIFVLFAIFSLFLHKLTIFSVNSAYDSAQVAISKLLIFGLLGYLVSLSAKNFMSHKHNEILNKHRQNSLLTFQSFADAMRGSDMQDIVLNHAASCIFSPQETGYTKSTQSTEAFHTRIIEAAPKISNPINP